MSDVPITDWKGCYDETWHGQIVKTAFGHPAKFSRNLIQCIYCHAVIEGWVKRGDKVIDPFGGVALGALDAMLKGLNWVGCELESQWALIGKENILKWQKRYGGFAKGKAVLIQGDSRNLAALLDRGDIALAVSSPPYINSLHNREDGIDWEKAKQNGEDGTGHYGPEGKDKVGERTYQARGAKRDDSNLETLKEGDFSLAVSSPPYETIATGAGGLNTKPAKKSGQQSGRKPTAASQRTDQRYGRGAGQLAIGTGDSFWTASRQIVEQVFLLLKPGSHAVFVCKDFVRNGKRFPFSDKWQTLCESVGLKNHLLHIGISIESECNKSEISQRSRGRNGCCVICFKPRGKQGNRELGCVETDGIAVPEERRGR